MQLNLDTKIRFRLKPLLLLIVFVVSSISWSTVGALDDYFFTTNDVLYYNPNASELCETDSDETVKIGGRNNLEKVFNYMLSKGLSREAAAGVIGNVSQESGGDPTIVQGGGHSKNPANISSGWGLIQWTPGSKVIKAAKDAGVTGPIHELSTQLDVLWGHMNNKPPITTGQFDIKAFKNMNDYKKATDHFEHNIEGAGDPQMENRYIAAKLALDEFGGQTSTSGADSSGEVPLNCDELGPGGAENGNAVKTALNYAWHDYRPAPYTKKKPSYDAAIRKAQSQGKYVGGLDHPGVDCGGFTTRVMQDSNVDPKYGGGGNTTTQQNYLKTSGRYMKLNPSSTGDLKPGDIAIKTVGGGHTYMYVGKNPGFETQIASASVSFNGTGWRAPMAGMEQPADPEYEWYRHK